MFGRIGVMFGRIGEERQEAKRLPLLLGREEDSAAASRQKVLIDVDELKSYSRWLKTTFYLIDLSIFSLLLLRI